MERENFINEKLEIYLDFDFLTAEQYSTIIYATNKVYLGVANSLIFGDFYYYNSPYVITYPLPLCLEEVMTGNSISTKFSLEKRFLPKIAIEDETLKIILPQWSAVLILSGIILSYGMDRYEKYLDIRLKQMEINEKMRQEVHEQAKRLENFKNQPNNPTATNIQQNVYLFLSQIYQPNIKTVEINGEKIHSKEQR